MTGSVVFREATREDREAIAALHISVSQQAYAGMLPAEYLADQMPAEKIRLWRLRLDSGVDRGRMCVVLAEEASALAGFSCCLFDEETAFGTYIHNLYVAPSHQGKGIARRLLAASVGRFPTERFQLPVHLLTISENLKARAFYESLNGRLVEEKKNVIARYPQVSFVRYQWPTASGLQRTVQPADLSSRLSGST